MAGTASPLPLRVEAWLPIPSLRSVNVYVFDCGGDGVWLVDSGMYSARSVHSLARGLREAGFDPARVRGVVATHFHVDHLTGAAVVSAFTGADVYLGERDLEVALAGGSPEAFIDSALRLFVENGMPEGEAREIRRSHPALRAVEAYRALLEAGVEPVRAGERPVPCAPLEAVVLPGHTPGHVALVARAAGYALVGDVVLEGITPHVTLHDPDSNPLGDYLESLRRLDSMGLRLLLPGHRGIISDPHKRVQELLRHHEERLREILGLLESRGPLTGYEVARLVRWRVRYSSWEEYPPAERFFAMGEALAHLRLLEERGLAARESRGSRVVWAAV